MSLLTRDSTSSRGDWIAGPGISSTDDRGAYRFAALAPWRLSRLRRDYDHVDAGRPRDRRCRVARPVSRFRLVLALNGIAGDGHPRFGLAICSCKRTVKATPGGSNALLGPPADDSARRGQNRRLSRLQHYVLSRRDDDGRSHRRDDHACSRSARREHHAHACRDVARVGHHHRAGWPDREIRRALVPAYAADSPLERSFEAAVTATGNGTFVFSGGSARKYMLKGWRLPQTTLLARELPADIALWGEMPITVGGAPLDGLALALRPGLTIAGRVVFDGAATTPAPPNLQTYIATAFVATQWPGAFGNRPRCDRAADRRVHHARPAARRVPTQAGELCGICAPRLFLRVGVTLDGRDLLVSPLVLGSEKHQRVSRSRSPTSGPR